MTPAIRHERAGDAADVSRLVTAAFAGVPHASGTEAEIVHRLRRDGALAAGYLANEEGRIVGYAAFSPVWIDGAACGWFGLGPVAVAPDRQGRGTGAALIEHGLAQLRATGARGCVVLGDPEYYGRFGFVADPALTYPGPPARYFQRILFAGEPPGGVVSYAAAFG